MKIVDKLFGSLNSLSYLYIYQTNKKTIMKRISKETLRNKLYMEYNLNVSTTQITLTKTRTNNVMIVEGIGGSGLFRYGYDNNGIIKVYPNKMHEINLNL